MIAAATSLVCSQKAADAADASAWNSGAHSAVRLIAGRPLKASGAPVLRAGIELKMDTGWKTYWRHPGDSGVPPRFEFGGSRNVKDIQVSWPAPVRFADGGGMSVGYTTQVVLPLRVIPLDPLAPATVRLRLVYAVCEKLCVPEDAELELTLDTTEPSHEAALRASEARVPKRAAIGADGPLAIMAVSRGPGPKPRVTVDIITRRDVDEIDLFAEGPSADWSLPLPEPVAGAASGVRRFAFELDGLPPGAEPQGATLTLTAVTGAEAIEVAYHLD